MPLYEYECKSCNKVIEVMQRISDSPLESCPECSGAVQKMVSMSSFKLKGGGWYADGYSSSSGGSDGKASSSTASDSTSSAGCGSACAGGACGSA